MLDRRHFVKGLAASLPLVSIIGSAAPTPHEQSLLNSLVAGTYVGNLKLMVPSVPSYGFGLNFALAQNPPSWRVRSGNYNGAWQVHGYWMYHPTQDMCWQAYNYGSPLRYWNEDHKANPDKPEDWEIFKFEWFNQSAGTVRIRQGRSTSLIGLTGNTFNLDAGQFVSKAAEFSCIFA